MAGRRAISYFSFMATGNTQDVNILAEAIALIISGFVLMGIIKIRPMLVNLFQSKAELEMSNEQLKESEREKSLILQTIQEILVFLDRQLSVQWTNQAALNLANRSKDAVNGDFCYKLWFDRDAPCKNCPSLKALKTGKTEEAEIAYQDKIFLVRSHPVIENNEITGLLEVSVDITKQKTAENLLANSESKFRMFFYENTAVKLLIDPDSGQIIDANKSACHFYGYDNLEEKFIQEINQLAATEVKEEMRNACEQKKNYFFFVHKLADGQLRNVEVYSTPLVIDGKRYLYSIIHDITERVRAQEKLEKSEHKFRKIVNALPQFVSFVDKELNYVFVNQTYLDFFKLTEEQIIGNNIINLIGRQVYEKAKPHIYKVLRGEIVHYSELFSYPNKVRVNMEGTLIPEFDQDGNVEGYYAVLSDITHHVMNQQLLEESRNRLRLLSKHQRDMLERERSYIAREIHDELGQNLSAINMDLAMLKKKISRKDRDMFSKLQELSHITQSTLVKTKNLLSELRPQLIDDMGLIAAIEWYSSVFQKRSSIQCSTNLLDEETYFPKDMAIHIYRIVQEALNNVYKHAHATAVTIHLSQPGNYYHLKIVDNGRGIPQEYALQSNSLGIMGMEERVYLLNGTFNIKGTTKGTTINIKIPKKDD